MCQLLRMFVYYLVSPCLGGRASPGSSATRLIVPYWEIIGDFQSPTTSAIECFNNEGNNIVYQKKYIVYQKIRNMGN